MFFDYVAMMGVPVLLVLLAVSSLIFPGGNARNGAGASGPGGVIRTVLLILIAAGAIVYGAIGIREAYIHGSSHGGSHGRRRQ